MGPFERAAKTIQSLGLTDFTEELLAALLRNDETSQPAFNSLLFLRDAPILEPLLAEIEEVFRHF